MSTRAERRRNSRRQEKATRKNKGRRVGGWLLLLIVLFFFGSMLSEVFFPFQGNEYLPVSHGDHKHYVPADRNPDVPVSSFPTQPPASGERILPNGQVVTQE